MFGSYEIEQMKPVISNHPTFFVPQFYFLKTEYDKDRRGSKKKFQIVMEILTNFIAAWDNLAVKWRVLFKEVCMSYMRYTFSIHY